MLLGELIQNYLNEHKMTYAEFAKKSNLTKGYISMLINNRNPNTGKPLCPKIQTYNDIASAMGMSIDELFEMIDDSPVSLSQEDVKNASKKLKEISEEVFMSPSKSGKWVMLTKWFGDMNMNEFDMWYNAIAANHNDEGKE